MVNIYHAFEILQQKVELLKKSGLFYEVKQGVL